MFSYTCFIFDAGGRRHMFLAYEAANRQVLQLSKGDRVVLVTQRFEAEGGAAADMVYTLVNIDAQQPT